jgi:YgiT-type zinc finger domain-containing protein
LEAKEGVVRLFEKCPICGGNVVEKEVEKVLKGGTNTAIIRVTAEVCLHCGERLYKPYTISWLDGMRENLCEGDVTAFELVGATFHVA